MRNIIDIQQFQQFNNLELIAKQVVEGFITGLHRSPFHGFSVEFAEHRPYNKGESTKNIDWKLFARTEKLFVKRFEEETNLRAHIIIDTSSSMLFPYKDGDIQNKLFFSVYCTAALIYLLRKQRDAVGLSFFSDKTELHTPARLSSVHATRLFAELQKLLSPDYHQLKKPTLASKALHEIAENIHKRSLIILFTDMMDSGNSDDLFSALQHLRYNKHEVILFHVTDKKREGNFEYSNRPYKFVDLESGEQVKVRPAEVRESYIDSIAEYNKT
ncbi:MAG: DUF58 domain-containing protein, partial [Bacteroidales bacterium]|nr:DUF58 domain-containing protein [Bacteroidales bacterium]